MQGRIAAEMKDPIMRGLAYGLGGYVGMSFIYSVTNKEGAQAAAKKEEVHAAAPAAVDSHKAGAAPVQHAVAAAAADHHELATTASGKQQVAPVLQQLNSISDRLSKIEKALGI